MPVPYLEYSELKRIADGFLAKHHPSGDVPVPIERIVDVAYGVDIVPFPGLQEKIRTDGFSDNAFTTIYVEERVYNQAGNRYRFTLAHEMSHQILHSEYRRGHDFRSTDDWIRFQKSVDSVEYARFESQANHLAGLILVPTEQLLPRFREKKRVLLQNPNTNGVREDFVCELIAENIAPDFVVSSKTLEIRLKLEEWHIFDAI